MVFLDPGDGSSIESQRAMTAWADKSHIDVAAAALPADGTKGSRRRAASLGAWVNVAPVETLLETSLEDREQQAGEPAGLPSGESMYWRTLCRAVF